MYAGRPDDLGFAIDGAVSLARSAAMFSSDQGALTSRTVRFLSQSTITEREVNSNPNVPDLNSPVRGPGFVAPIGLGAHFPPGVNFTPPVDLFGIENTNRDSLLHPDANGVKAAGDTGMVQLPSRFNVATQYIPAGQDVAAPESYGYVTGKNIYAQARGIATMPGGEPIYTLDAQGNPHLVGGIGVFFPGPFGYASYEEGYVDGANQSAQQLENSPLALEAEWMAFAAVAGDLPATAVINGVGPVPGVGYGPLYQEQINLVGVQVEAFGPNPTSNEAGGIPLLLQVGANSGASVPTPAFDQPIDATGTRLYGASRPVPVGWIVMPHDSPLGQVTAADVTQIITQGIVQAEQVRSAIREEVIPGDVNLSPGPRSEMILSVDDEQGNVLGLYRMPGATVFSLDVAVAKARNVSYFSNANQIQPIDQIDPMTGQIVLPAGAAYTNRTFRFLADPRFPYGIDGTPPGPFSIL
ncbi:MAG: dockerin type I domain-containing protein, partial [Pirellulales bacterium]